MFRNLFHVLPFICWLSSFGQFETKEEFVNKIFSQTPYSTWGKVYFSDNASGWGRFDYIDSTIINIPAVLDSIPQSSFSEIVANCGNSFSEKWKSMPGMKIVNVNSRRFRKQRHRSLMYKRSWVFISNIVFDNSRDYAMVRMGKVCGITCGESDVYFFKRVDKEWQLVLKVGRVII